MTQNAMRVLVLGVAAILIIIAIGSAVKGRG